MRIQVDRQDLIDLQCGTMRYVKMLEALGLREGERELLAKAVDRTRDLLRNAE